MQKAKTTHFLHSFNNSKSSFSNVFKEGNLAESVRTSPYNHQNETKESPPQDSGRIQEIREWVRANLSEARIELKPQNDIPYIRLGIFTLCKINKQLNSPKKKLAYRKNLIILVERLRHIFTVLEAERSPERSLGQIFSEFNEKHYKIAGEIRKLRWLCLEIWLEAEARQLEVFYNALLNAKA